MTVTASCGDARCGLHGSVKVRGSVFFGVVVSAKSPKTVSVERELVQFVQKYERYKKKRSRVHAHNPPCQNAAEGDRVGVGETRKLSKTKAFVVLSVEKRATHRVPSAEARLPEQKKKHFKRESVEGGVERK